VSEENIRKWFDEMQEYIRKNNLEEVMDDPSRIFNGDNWVLDMSIYRSCLSREGGKKHVFN
jgi:hypothetical protein